MSPSRNNPILQAILRRARKIDDTSSLQPTADELTALRQLLAAVLDVAWARGGHRLPKHAKIHGVKVYIGVTLAGQVFLRATATGPALIASGPFRV
jgi:hypothetical protein